jgi:hypothetical protein
LKAISGGLAQSLKGFFEKGGTVVIFPSENIDLESYGIFAGTIGTPSYTRADTLDVRVSDINTQHPLFYDVFDEIPDNIDLPIVISYYRITKPSRSDFEVLLKLQNDDTFLGVDEVEKGQLYMFSVPLDPAFSNLPRHAIFVPALYKMALLSEPFTRLYYTIGIDQVVEMNIVQLNGDQVFKLKSTISNFEFIPEHRNAGARTYIYPHDQIKEAGNYVLMNGENELLGVSFNYDRNESNLECYTINELDEFAGDYTNFTVISETKKPFSTTIEELTIGKRIWKWFVLMALLCLLGEVIVLRFL